MSWTDTNWKQIDDQYPTPINANYPPEFDISKVYSSWSFSPTVIEGYPNPIGVPQPIPFDLDKVYSIFRFYPGVMEGYPAPINLDTVKIGAFAYLTNLTSITIPSSVKHIGRYAFYKTGLQHVTLADDCTYYSTSFPPESQCQVDGGICLY